MMNGLLVGSKKKRDMPILLQIPKLSQVKSSIRDFEPPCKSWSRLLQVWIFFIGKGHLRCVLHFLLVLLQ